MNHLFLSQDADAAEVLQFVIDELKGTPMATSDLISNTIRINVSCSRCNLLSTVVGLSVRCL